VSVFISGLNCLICMLLFSGPSFFIRLNWEASSHLSTTFSDWCKCLYYLRLAGRVYHNTWRARQSHSAFASLSVHEFWTMQRLCGLSVLWFCWWSVWSYFDW
jgi:hypothetical protein